MASTASLSGQMLLAMPGMSDPRFHRAAILMCVHDAGGALGIGIGRTLQGLGLHELMTQLEIEPGAAPDRPVHIGGPVEVQRGFVLHSRDWLGPETLDVAGAWGMTATLDVLRALADGAGPAHWMVALGYAGWSAGQLEGELCRHGWFAVPADDALLFETPARDRWTTAFARAGIDHRLLAGEAGSA